MVYNFNNILNGFCENRKIKSIPLYLFNDIKSLNSSKLISEKQKKFLNTSFALETQHFGFFPDEEFALGGAIAVIKKSQEPKKSLIDQAAKLSLFVNNAGNSVPKATLAAPVNVAKSIIKSLFTLLS